MPGPSPLVGYNTNVRHKGKLYHIQTEDSGVNHPHVITHLFADGGRIIASRKTAYAEHLGAKDLSSIVKKLMQDQHKSMFIELRDCVYDDEPQLQATVPIEATVAAAAVVNAKSAAAAVATGPTALPAPAVSARPPPPPPAALSAAPPRVASIAPRTAVAVAAPRFVGTPPPMAMPSRVMLDADSLDRAAEERLLGSTIGRARVEASRRGVGRYQQTVPAKPSVPPRPNSNRSIFGGEALRGKSLDEVILSYLSDDTGESER
jgi:hypothetical protein